MPAAWRCSLTAAPATLRSGSKSCSPTGTCGTGSQSLRKDNSGYDLKDLIIGSEGTLGIITAAVLRLFPKPAERVTCMAGLRALETAPAFFARARAQAGPALTAFEIMPRIGLEFVLRHGSSVRDPFASPHPWYVLFELTSPREGEELARLAESVLGEGIEAGEIDSAVIAASLAQAQELWRLRELMSEVQKHEGGSIKHDVAVPIARVPEFVARANQLVELMIPGRAARAVRPSRRRQYPLQCQPAARHGSRDLPEPLGRAQRRRASRSCSTSAARSAPSTASAG